MSGLVKLILLWLFITFGYIAFVHAAGTLPATLTWGNPDTADPIQIEKGASPIGLFTILTTVSPGTFTYLDATNGPGETACFRVAYSTVSGVGTYAGPVCKIFPPLPSQTPSGLTVK